jgi:hypothetical protein
MDSAQRGRALWRAHILLAGLHGATSGSYAFAMALRSSRRRQLRDAWLDGSSDTMPADFQVQSAISTHIADGGFLPPDIPLEYVHYVEEDACYAFHEIGDSWSGLRRWQDANFFLFDRDPTRLDKLEGL